jgi:type 1 glutamine amidotransferase
MHFSNRFFIQFFKYIIKKNKNMKKALIVWGGWDGHTPKETAQLFERELKKNNFDVMVADNWNITEKIDMFGLDLIIPLWTMGEITEEHRNNVLKAVASGVGIAGCHGGMNDAFRNDTWWQFMTGSQWVEHPGGDGIEYEVNIKAISNPITDGIKDFIVKSEHYYIHVDPCVEVLATTKFPNAPGLNMFNPICDVPVVYTKLCGYGRVFYTSLGHTYKIFEDYKDAKTIMVRGMIWAANGKIRNGDLKQFKTWG